MKRRIKKPRAQRGPKSIATVIKMWLEREGTIAAYNRTPPGSKRRQKRKRQEYR